MTIFILAWLSTGLVYELISLARLAKEEKEILVVDIVSCAMGVFQGPLVVVFDLVVNNANLDMVIWRRKDQI